MRATGVVVAECDAVVGVAREVGGVFMVGKGVIALRLSSFALASSKELYVCSVGSSPSFFS